VLRSMTFDNQKDIKKVLEIVMERILYLYKQKQ
jgi:hypothetical protein